MKKVLLVIALVAGMAFPAMANAPAKPANSRAADSSIIRVLHAITGSLIETREFQAPFLVEGPGAAYQSPFLSGHPERIEWYYATQQALSDFVFENVSEPIALLVYTFWIGNQWPIVAGNNRLAKDAGLPVKFAVRVRF